MTEKRKRRWFQFSLRALLVFVLLVSIGMSWLGVKIARARKQREAVEVIENLWGDVRYSPSPGPAWVRKLLGDDFFLDVVWVDLKNPEVTDDDLQHLEVLANLEILCLTNTQLTDNGLQHLKGLTNLRYLDLTNTQLTDDGLQHLKGLANLQDLFLSGTELTDDGLQHLKGLTNLQYLYLSSIQATPEGIEKLQQALPNCIIYN